MVVDGRLSPKGRAPYTAGPGSARCIRIVVDHKDDSGQAYTGIGPLQQCVYAKRSEITQLYTSPRKDLITHRR